MAIDSKHKLLERSLLRRFPPPESPGVYLMKDSAGKTIYIGKAKNLADRVPTYFSGKLEDPKTRLLVSKVRSIEYIIVKNEVSALLLEAQLIRDVRPKFNIDLKEGVRYAYLKITDNEQYPKILVTRRVTPGGTYFGPYTSGSSRIKALALLRRVFGIRACKCRSATKFCMKYHIFNPEGRPIERELYMKSVERVKGFLSGKNVAGIRRQLVSEMESASQMQRYELARLIRDQIRAIDELSKPQSIEAANVVGNRDFVAFSRGRTGGLVAVVLKVRCGVLLKKEKYGGLDDVLGFLALYYSLPDGMPDEIVAAGVGGEKLSLFRAATSELLAGQGRKVRIVSHSTDDTGRELEETAKRNAEFEALGRASPALSELMDALSLKEQPRVIEGFDISNLGPTCAVGSMVQFVDGRPNKSGYRLFKIKTVLGQNDFAMMAEVVGRRYSKEKLPDLILLDGGAGQLSAVIRVLAALGMKDAKIAALAKENEELRTPGRSGVVALQKSSPALKLLMHVRDEAHRFAISYQKKLRKIEQNL